MVHVYVRTYACSTKITLSVHVPWYQNGTIGTSKYNIISKTTWNNTSMDTGIPVKQYTYVLE